MQANRSVQFVDNPTLTKDYYDSLLGKQYSNDENHAMTLAYFEIIGTKRK